MFKRIEANPDVMVGKPVVKGTRIPVYLVLELLASGYSNEQIIQEYPDLTEEDIRECLEYAAALAKGEEVDLLEVS